MVALTNGLNVSDDSVELEEVVSDSGYGRRSSFV